MGEGDRKKKQLIYYHKEIYFLKETEKTMDPGG